MQKAKKEPLKNHPQKQSHSRNPSAQRQRDSHPRLTLCSPPLRTAKHYLSSPNSLEKQKHRDPKKPKRKLLKAKKHHQEATRETIETAVETVEGAGEPWKEQLRLTFRPRKNTQKDMSVRNNSLKCMEELAPIDSYSSLITTFPHSGSLPAIPSKERVYLIDWLNFLSAELLLRKNTLHLAVAFIEAYLQQGNSHSYKLQVLGAAALLLAVKQEQRGCEGEVLTVLSGCEGGLRREEILNVESRIVLGLGFKLNFSTLPFWFDYFSQKWDGFCLEEAPKRDFLLPAAALSTLRSPDSYKHYREAVQLLDALLINPLAGRADFAKLALAVLYLVVRVQTEAKQFKEESNALYGALSTGFARKTSPIFRDRCHFNEVFNEFVSGVCEFEMGELLGEIRAAGVLASMGFTYEIDSRAYESAQNYEEFLRLCTYSDHIRAHFLPRT